MNKPTIATITLFALALTVACGKATENDPAAPATEKETSATQTSAPASEAKASAAAGEDSLVCCAFGDAIGTATAAKCAEFKGKEVPNLAPPCTK